MVSLYKGKHRLDVVDGKLSIFSVRWQTMSTARAKLVARKAHRFYYPYSATSRNYS